GHLGRGDVHESDSHGTSHGHLAADSAADAVASVPQCQRRRPQGDLRVSPDRPTSRQPRAGRAAPRCDDHELRCVMLSIVLFLGLRALHVLLAATWIGSTIFISTLLTPAVAASGSSGGQVMMNINRRGITAYMGALGALTILTGLYLLWRFAGGFGAICHPHPGIALGLSRRVRHPPRRRC